MRFSAYNKVLIEDMCTLYVLRILIGDCCTSKEARWKYSEEMFYIRSVEADYIFSNVNKYITFKPKWHNSILNCAVSQRKISEIYALLYEMLP
jgi:hypothetical protein